jgi:hypothetical protein
MLLAFKKYSKTFMVFQWFRQFQVVTENITQSHPTTYKTTKMQRKKNRAISLITQQNAVNSNLGLSLNTQKNWAYSTKHQHFNDKKLKYSAKCGDNTQ